jgi:hypothetical protein
MRRNFGDSRSTSLSLDEFLAEKEADGFEFLDGKEPWLKGATTRKAGHPAGTGGISEGRGLSSK